MEAADVFYNREDLWQFPRGVIRRYFLGLINRLVIFSAYGLGCALFLGVSEQVGPRVSGGGMVFRTAGAITMLLIGLGGAGGQALAQYYPPPQAYPAQAYPPPQGYPPRQPLAPGADADDDAPLNAPVLQGPPLPPVGVPQANERPAGTRYGRGTPAYPADAAQPLPGGGQGQRPVQPSQGYEPAVVGTRPYYGASGAIPPGPPGSAEQDAILQEAMRSRLPISRGQIGAGPDDPRGVPRNVEPPEIRSVQPPQGYETVRPYYGVPGAIPPGPAGSAEQDAIRQEAMRSRLRASPGQIGPRPDEPDVTGSTGGGDPGNMAAFPPDVRPETGPKKELPPQFRRTLVDYPTKEPAGTIIIDTPNTYLYFVLGNGKALRYGVGVGREGFTWSGVQQVTRMAEWPDWNPPEEMIVRQPYLPRFMAGGETNPLGARALYLGNTIYRIHGTNQPSTIGTFVSSGCIRLTNEDVMDLYTRIKVGTRVVVLPGRPPATATATSVAPLPAMPPGNGSPPSAMAR
jgi:lipoprotein-anchoring transpeptidase ErfK/SrfK